MDELISRQAAIDALKQQADTMSEWSNRYAEQRKGILTAVNIVEDLPPAQPEQLGTNLAEVGTDCISRQAAINAVGYYSLHSGDKLLFADKPLKELPSAEPKIIYCKDCKHFVREDVEEYTPYGYNTHFYAFCDKHWDGEQGEYIDVNLDDFCSFAERREDG